MIVTVDELKSQVDCGEMSDEVIVSRLKAIEEIIRKYTNNNFQITQIRFVCESKDNVLYGASPFIKPGDTIQISQSTANDGLFTVLEVTDEQTIIDAELFPIKNNKVTKIQYPKDVVQCAIDLFAWKLDFGAKIGIKSESETLSRHSTSTTYEDSQTLFMGYPVGILSGLSLYMKARF